MATSRRKFISTTSLGFLGLNLFGSNLINFSTFSTDKKVIQTIPEILQAAALKRRQGKLVEAKALYEDVISIDGKEIRAYDGIRKILLQTKHKELEVLHLYSTGLSQNPDNFIFKERVAKEYMRLALGNAKFVNQLNSPNDLLELSKDIFFQLQNSDPNNVQFVAQFNKAERKIEQDANTVDARKNLKIKEYKKSCHITYKKRFENQSEPILEDKLSQLLNEPKNKTRDNHIKELYLILITRYSSNINLSAAHQKMQALYQLAPKDTNTLRVIRKVCKKHALLKELEAFEMQNDISQQTFWSKIALVDVMLKRAEIGEKVTYTQIQQYLNEASGLKFMPHHKFEINSRLFKFYVLKKDPRMISSMFIKFADSISGIPSAHFIDRFNRLCAWYLQRINDHDRALEVLSIALGEIEKKPEDAFLKKIYEVNENKSKESKPIHNERLGRLRSTLMSN